MKNMNQLLTSFVLLIGLIVSAQTITNYGVDSGTLGDYNSFYGYSSGESNTTGTQNTFLGAGTGSGNTTGSNNVFIGHFSGISNTIGYNNVFNGSYAGRFNTAGFYNVFLGSNSGHTNSTGYANTFVGNNSGFENTVGEGNVFFGNHTGYMNTTGNSNVFNGNYAGYKNITGGNNIYLGDRAGYENTSGSGNVFIGYNVGYNETGSDKLYIDNTDTSIPLIYGDFSTNQLGINTNIIPTGYAFSVKGKMIAEELKIQVFPWSDFVFEAGYDLPTLAEVEVFIKTHGHLMDIPNAQEVAESGIELGDMNAKLLQKIEELTLYTIEQEKELQQQKDKNRELEERLSKLEAFIDKNLK